MSPSRLRAPGWTCPDFKVCPIILELYDVVRARWGVRVDFNEVASDCIEGFFKAYGLTPALLVGRIGHDAAKLSAQSEGRGDEGVGAHASGGDLSAPQPERPGVPAALDNAKGCAAVVAPQGGRRSRWYQTQKLERSGGTVRRR